MARHLPRLRVLALAGSAFLPACSGCDGLPAVHTLESPPPIDRLQVVPAVVKATPGDTLLVSARAYDEKGAPIDLDLYGYAVEWSAASDLLSVVPDGAHAVVGVPPSSGTPGGGGTETGTAVGSYSVTAVAAGLAASVAVEVTVPGEAELDQVDGESVSPQTIALLIQGEDDAGPVTDRTVGASGHVDLEVNLRPRTSDGISEVVAFAAGHNILARGPDGTVPAWTTGTDVIDADPLVDLDAGVRSVDVRIGIPPVGSTSAEASITSVWAEDQIAAALELMDANRVGIELFSTATFEHSRVDTETGMALGVDDPSGACGSVEDDLAGQPGIGDQVLLYVLFVPRIQSTTRGWACVPAVTEEEGWLARAVYISISHFAVSSVAHEIAHLLGLWVPYLSRLGAHPTNSLGFDESNIMWASSSLEKAILRDHLSLGQAYRMNVDEGSWLNLRVLEGSPSLQWTRDCDFAPSAGACPALAADLAGSGS